MEEKGASTCLDFLGGLCSGFLVCVCVCVCVCDICSCNSAVML